MNNAYKQVVTFNQEVLGVAQRPLGMLSTAEHDISVRCLIEEAQELRDSSDLVSCIDAAIDSIYFGMGALYKMGVDEEVFGKLFTAVHEANMEKKLGRVAKRETGAADAFKPLGWVSPEERLTGILLEECDSD